MAEATVVLFRVDPRLIHATLTNAWVPARGAKQLIVADAAVAADDRRRNIAEIAAIDVGRVQFVDEAEVSHVLRDSAGATIVLFSHLGAVETAVANGLTVPVLNVGHVPAGPGREQHLPAIYLGDEELASIDRLSARGVRVELQPLPDDPVVVLDRPADEVAPIDDRAEAELEIVNERGLHLRAAHVLAGLCSRLSNDVEVGREGHMVNAKSLLGLTTLGAAAGTRLTVVVTGPGSPAALDAIRELFASGFNEGVAPGRKGTE